MNTINEISILNVGCGNEMYGTERIDIMPTAATTKVYDITKGLPYPDNSFDIVYCSYVWEHMLNPYNLLLEMKRVCKHYGKIVVITDNAGYIFTHMESRGLHGNYSDQAVHGLTFNKKDKHYALYTPEHLRNFFETAGLKVKQVQINYWRNVNSKKSRFIHELFRLILGRRFAYPSVEILGEKP